MADEAMYITQIIACQYKLHGCIWQAKNMPNSVETKKLTSVLAHFPQELRASAPDNSTSNTTYVSEQAASCFQWLTGSVMSRVAADAQKSIISMVLKMEELLDQHAAYRTQRSVP
jgi:hypothetical protein